jgi:7-cyano-7-deazaguanine synthase
LILKIRGKLTKNDSNIVLVLLSGGIDSAACLDFYLSQEFAVEAIFFEYGQLSAKRESEAAKNVCEHYNVPLIIVSCEGSRKKTGGLILGRNAFLLHGALLEFRGASGIIAIGVHSGTSYMDCSDKFIKLAQSIFDAYTDGSIRIGTPFLEWTKSNILDYCIERNVPLHLTYSCELGLNQPCGRCLSCLDLEALNVSSKLSY